MDTSSLLIGIGGMVLTAIAGIIGTWLAIKYRAKPAKIAFYRESCIGLFDAIVKNLPELSITYEGVLVSEQIVLLKGYLINEGSKDVAPQKVERPLLAALPEGYRWLEAKITNSSPNIQANIKIADKNKLEFDIGLFKPNEFIHFDALAEVPSNNTSEAKNIPSASRELINALSFEHRIEDVKKVEQLPLNQDLVRKIFLLFMFSLFFLILSWFSGFMDVVGLKTNSCGIVYEVRPKSGEIVTVRAFPNSDGTIKLKGIDNDYTEFTDSNSFFARQDIYPKVYSKPSKIHSLPVILFSFLILPLILTILAGKMYLKYRKTTKIVSGKD